MNQKQSKQVIIPMTLDQLRVFLAVARLEHVTRAAEELHLTQSAVSAAISALEARHDVRLFDRIGRGISLTQAGHAFVPHARAVLQRAEEAGQALGDMGTQVAGNLRLGASQTVASYWLPPILMRYLALHPAVSLELRAGNTSTVAAGVLEGTRDLGVVEGPIQHKDLQITPLVQDQLAILVGQNHPWAQGQRLQLKDFLTSHWILREAGSGTRAGFDQALLQAGLSPKDLPILMELPSNEACIAAVEAGVVATVLSRRAAAPHLAQGLLYQATFDFVPREFSLITHRERHLSKAALALIDLLRSDPSAETRD